MRVLQDETEEIASAVQHFGNPVSTLLLGAPYRIFRLSHLEGIMGYQVDGNCAIVMGDPVCEPQNMGRLTEAFHRYCKENQWEIIYLLASEDFAHWAVHHGCETLIQAGEVLILDPTHFREKQKLRWKIHQSLRQGVVIKEYKGEDPSQEKRIKDTLDLWMKGRHGPQIYLGGINLLETLADKRIYYAVHKEKIVGLAILLHVESFKGWVVTCLLSIPEAPVGTTEHLMHHLIETLGHENCHSLCLGVVCGADLGEMVGLNTFSKWVARALFKISKRLFRLDAKMIYLHKYLPRPYPAYILFSGKLSIKSLLEIKKILNVRFL